jgi:hypothetical protein
MGMRVLNSERCPAQQPQQSPGNGSGTEASLRVPLGDSLKWGKVAADIVAERVGSV